MIVVTAPTGNIGSQVLATLLENQEPVRVIVRDPARLATQTQDRVEVVAGSHGDPTTIHQALADADALFWLPPPNPKAESVEAVYVDFTRPACDAIRLHNVKRVVSISALGRGTPMAKHAGHVTASLAMDDLIASTGADFRALTMPSFMDNVLRQVESIKNQGVFFGPDTPDRKSPTCATRDIAATAARLLLDPSWNGQGEVPVLGPEDLSLDDMARIVCEVLGKTVRYQQLSLPDYKAIFLKRGMSEAMAQGMVDMAEAKNNGLDNAEPRTPESTTPTPFRTWCEDVLKPAVLG